MISEHQGLVMMCRRRQSDTRLAVEEVNRRFYIAFEAGDMKASSSRHSSVFNAVSNPKNLHPQHCRPFKACYKHGMKGAHPNAITVDCSTKQ